MNLTFQERCTGHMFHSVGMMIHLPSDHPIFNGLTKKQTKRIRHKLRGCRSTSRSQRIFDLIGDYRQMNEALKAARKGRVAKSG